MHISYTLPLSKAWNRMKKALFQPFDLNKWLRLGFTAFLAGLVDCNGGNGGGNKSSFGDHNHWDEFFRFPQTAWDWLTSHPLLFNLIILGVVFFIVFISVLMWLSSRGKFMFLHNVVNDSADISKPWHDFRREGNSLFVWQFIYNWLVIAVVIGLMIFFFGFAIVAGYISLFLNDFVVPMMYKDRVGVFSGWLRFLVLFFRNPLTFVVYGLFVFGLAIVTVFIVIFFALFTCCIGLLLLIIPYIGSVVLLPVSYTFRALSIEFLAQFGEDYNVFPLPLA
jgi:hypothetical protein